MHTESVDPPQTPHPFQPQPRTPQTQTPMVYVYEQPKWEYRTVLKGPDQAEVSDADLSALGADGWELVGIGSLSGTLQLFFKRAIR
jgi:hypothetical protein